MQRGRYLNLAALAGALALTAGMAYGDAGTTPPATTPPATTPTTPAATTPPATTPATPAASTLPAGWTDVTVGKAGSKNAGSTTVSGTGPTAVWTMTGTGDDVWAPPDRFDFAYTTLPGDGGITARLLTQTGGATGGWAKAGTMLRESTDPGARDAFNAFPNGPTNNLQPSFREKANTQAIDLGTSNPAGSHKLDKGPVWLRTQRQGTTYQHLISNDGKNWLLVAQDTVAIPAASPVLAGLFITQNGAGTTNNVTLDNVSVSADVIQPVASDVVAAPSNVTAVPGNGAVLLTFSSAPGSAGVNIYRQTQGGKDTPVLLNAEPDLNGWFIDTEAPNGTAFLYTIKSVTDLSAVGGSRTTEAIGSGATVVAQPQGPNALGLTLNYLGAPLPATLDLTGGVLTLKAQGSDIWSTTENGIFLARPVSGDYSMNAKVLEQPTAIAPNKSNNVKVGPMIADAPSNYSQYAYVFATSGRTPNAVLFEGQTNVPAGKNFSEGGTKTADTKYPLWLKLSKAGSAISAYQSNDGTTWTAVGTSHDYGELPAVTYAGIGMSSADAKNFGSAKLDAASIIVGAPYTPPAAPATPPATTPAPATTPTPPATTPAPTTPPATTPPATTPTPAA